MLLDKAIDFHQSGEIDKARHLYRKTLERNPGCHEALHLLGVLLHQAGDQAQSIKLLEKAIRLKPDEAEYHYNYAEILRDLGKPVEALNRYQAAIQIDSHQGDYHYGLGIAHYNNKNYSSAISAYLNALAINPEDADIHNNLGNALVEISELEKARFHYSKAISHSPGTFRYQINLANCLLKLSRYNAAEQVLQKAARSSPNIADIQLKLGICCQEQGRFHDASKHHLNAIKINPALTASMFHLAHINPAGVNDEQIASLQRIVESGSDSAQHVFGHFALGKIYHARDQTELAFSHFDQGNRIKSESAPFNPDQFTRYIDTLIEFFSEDYFDAFNIPGNPSMQPVFIVGMPRSGSSLVEQIISAHPDAAGIGEHDFMRQLVRKLPGLLHRDEKFPQCLRGMNLSTIDDISSKYLSVIANSITSPSDQAARIVCDKMLGNFLRLGLIAILFPKSRIINCRRNPLDTCVSCYMQNFENGMRFTYNLDHLGLAYKQYQRLMEHWQQVVPVPIHHLDYETLIEDTESTCRKLIEFCGLQWSDDCLAYYQHNRPVKTASFWQVRQPVYSSSINKWEKYQPYIGPLLDHFPDIAHV